ncbi:MAG: hypothetical protein AAF599_08810 [Bacteroidota bacterium]
MYLGYPEEGLALYERAIKLDPSKQGFILTGSLVHFENGLYELTKARICFNRQQYDSADEYIWQAESKANEVEKAFIYPLKIKLYYETERDIEAITNSFKTFLHRLKSRLPKNHQYVVQRFRYFNNICAKLPKLNDTGTIADQLNAISSLEIELYDEGKHIPEKEWLLNVLELQLPRKIGKALYEKRLQLKEQSNPFLLSNFEHFLEEQKQSMTSDQYKANFNFLRFLKQENINRQDICKEIFLAERPYFLNH